MENSVGVIGGLGPAATAYFLERVIDFTEVKCDQDHINMIIYNHATIPDRSAYIIGKNKQNPLPLMIADAKALVSLGCQFLVMPCNTAHYFYEDIQKTIEIPIFNIVEETIKMAKLRQPKLRTIGIMATDGTVSTETYQQAAEKFGLNCVVPNDEMQEKVMEMIYEGVKAGKFVSKDRFDEVAKHLRNLGSDTIVLGCTELSVLKDLLNLSDEDIIDSIDVLAIKTVEMSGKLLSGVARKIKGDK